MTPGFQPQSDPPTRRKWGSHGQGLGKLGGGANLPNGQEAGRSGKGGGKHCSWVGRGWQSHHQHHQKLARQAVLYQAHRGLWVKATLSAKPTKAPLDALVSLPVCSTGYTGCTFNSKPTEYSLSALIGPQAKFEGFTLVEWSQWTGRCISRANFALSLTVLLPRVAVPIIDQGQRVIAVLAGRPLDNEGSNWHQVDKVAENAMRAAQMNCSKQPEHRRGAFLALPVGVSFGGGQQV